MDGVIEFDRARDSGWVEVRGVDELRPDEETMGGGGGGTPNRAHSS